MTHRMHRNRLDQLAQLHAAIDELQDASQAALETHEKEAKKDS